MKEFKNLMDTSRIRGNLLDWMLTQKDKSIYCSGVAATGLVNYLRYKNCKVEYEVEIDGNKIQNCSRNYDIVILYEVPLKNGDIISLIRNQILNTGGKIVLIANNPLGVSYFNGFIPSGEVEFFSTISNHYKSEKNFYRKDQLLDLLDKQNIKDFKFYYPYPNADFTESVFSDAHLPQLGELHMEEYPYETYRLQLFREQDLNDRFIEAGMWDRFANSYMVVIGEALPDIDYVKYSNNRADGYNIVTALAEGKYIVKRAADNASVSHVNKIEKLSEILDEKFSNTPLEINHCEVIDNGSVKLDYVKGIRFDNLLDRVLLSSNEVESKKTFWKWIDEYIGYVRKIYPNEKCKYVDIDLIFQNIIIDDVKWNVIDYEWTFEKEYPTKFIIYRAIFFYYYQSSICRAKIGLNELYVHCGIDQLEVKEFEKLEKNFQSMVTTNDKSLLHSDDDVIKLSDQILSIQVKALYDGKYKKVDNIQIPINKQTAKICVEFDDNVSSVEFSSADINIIAGIFDVKINDKNCNDVIISSVGHNYGDGYYIYPNTPFIFRIEAKTKIKKIECELDIITTKIQYIIRTMRHERDNEEKIMQINQLNDIKTQHEQIIGNLNDEVAQLRNIISEKDNLLNDIYSSRSWKLARKLAKIVHFFKCLRSEK